MYYCDGCDLNKWISFQNKAFNKIGSRSHCRHPYRPLGKIIQFHPLNHWHTTCNASYTNTCNLLAAYNFYTSYQEHFGNYVIWHKIPNTECNYGEQALLRKGSRNFVKKGQKIGAIAEEKWFLPLSGQCRSIVKHLLAQKHNTLQTTLFTWRSTMFFFLFQKIGSAL